MQVQDTASLMPDVTAPSANTDAATLRGRAVEFEAILLANVLEKLEHTYSCVPGEQSADAAHDTENSLETQALAEGIAKAGGFGFAKMILKYLSPLPESPPGTETVQQPGEMSDRGGEH